MREAFTKARDYQAKRKKRSEKKDGDQPERDLKLEPLVDILGGKYKK